MSGLSCSAIQKPQANTRPLVVGSQGVRSKLFVSGFLSVGHWPLKPPEYVWARRLNTSWMPGPVLLQTAPTSDILIIGYDNIMSWKGFRNLNAKSMYYQGVPFLKVDRVHNKPVVLAFLPKVCNTKHLEIRGWCARTIDDNRYNARLPITFR